MQEIFKESPSFDSYLTKIQRFPCRDLSIKQTKECYSLMDLWLVLLHGLIFIINLYGLAISAFLYAQSLNVKPELSGIMQSATPLSAFIVGFVYNNLTSRKSYRNPYLFALAIMVVSNFLYFAAESLKSNNFLSIACLILGRVLFGVGGARLLTRKFVAVNVEPWALTKYSAILVGTTAASMCIGPGVASLLTFEPFDFLGIFPVTFYNALSFILMFVWAAILLLFYFFYEGYDKDKEAQKEALQAIR